MKEISLSLYRCGFYINESGNNKTIIRLNDGLNIKRFIDRWTEGYEGLYLLYKDRKVIGQFEFFSDNSLWSFKIDENFRGKGYGYIFLNEFLNYIKKNTEIKEVKLNVKNDNEVAINLYKKLGFEIIGINKCATNCFVMEIKL
jgi:ribosomal protein S18 acetylase RimI-like enzyme